MINSITEVLSDKDLLRPLFEDKETGLIAESWQNWFSILAMINGDNLNDGQRALYKKLSGNSYYVPIERKDVYLAIARRSGKSYFISGLVSAAALLLYANDKLRRQIGSVGETIFFAVVSPTREMSQRIKSYIQASFEELPNLRECVKGDFTASGFTLNCRPEIEIRIFTGAPSTTALRGSTTALIIADELSYYRRLEAGAVNNDYDIVNAARPSLLTVPGSKFIAISSPGTPDGILYDKFKEHHGKDIHNRTLFLKSDSKTMNETLPQDEIDEAYKDDPVSAANAYGGDFLQSSGNFIKLASLECLVEKGVTERAFDRYSDKTYKCFVDVSSGTEGGDGFAFCVGYSRRNLIDESLEIYIAKVLHFEAPFNPNIKIKECCLLAKAYGLNRVTGDRYGANLVTTQFKNNGITFDYCSKNKSELFKDFLSLANSKKLHLTDNPAVLTQAINLKRVARLGSEVIEKGSTPDDLINAVSGCASILATKRLKLGGGWNHNQRKREKIST